MNNALKLLLALFFLWPIDSFAALSIEGAVSNAGSGGTGTVTITTALTNDIIYVTAVGTISSGSCGTVSSVSDTGGHTWTQRPNPIYGSLVCIEHWWTLATTALTSDVITVTWSNASDGTRNTAFGVNGANLTTPFDTNASVPTSSSGTSVNNLTETLSTSSPIDLWIAEVRGSATLSTVTRPTVPGAFTQVVATGANQDISYFISSSTATNAGVKYSWLSNPTNSVMIVDAIQAAGSNVNPAFDGNIPLFFGGFPR